MVTTRSYPRILNAPKQSFFLFGVRGVGKSTWARTHFPDAYRVDLLDEERYHDLSANPRSFADELRTLRRGSWVVLDEVQRVPGLLNEVHRAIEEHGLKFVLLGSSARKLKTGGTNLLAGRALWKTLFPLLPEELGSDFDLERALRYGTVPIVCTASDPEATLAAYVQLYLREEIRGEALVRNLPGFMRFLPVAALFHGQLINVAGVARDSGVARMTVQSYLEILEDTLLATKLPAFEAKLRVRERRLPKLYWLDPGIVRAVKKSAGPVRPEERGALLEGWIHTLLRAYAEERKLCEEIFYWAPLDAQDLEVDFLLRKGAKFLAIEVRSASRFSSSQLKGLTAIGELKGVARRLLIYGGRQKLELESGIEVWPVATFVDALRRGTLWP